MPGLNQMGPENMGPMTGRRMGRCAGGNVQGPAYGRGFGTGYWRSRGCGRGFGPRARGVAPWSGPAAAPTPLTKEDLALRAQALEKQLEAVRKDLDSLSGE